MSVKLRRTKAQEQQLFHDLCTGKKDDYGLFDALNEMDGNNSRNGNPPTDEAGFLDLKNINTFIDCFHKASEVYGFECMKRFINT